MKKLTSAALAALLLAGNPAMTFAEETQPETGSQEQTQEITEEPGTRHSFREFRRNDSQMTEGELPELPEGTLPEDGTGFRPDRRPMDGEMTPPEDLPALDGETGATPEKPEGELIDDGNRPDDLPEISTEMRKGKGMDRGFSKEDMEFIENNEEAKSIMDQIKELMQKLRDLINSQKDTDTVTSDSL